ncbi:MAG: HIT domain-containing protein [Kineosporiaceae bacterium]|nr:HIT domain-containing protein [Kineosporiaceae bacterium]
MAERTECLFCRIVDGDLPATLVHEGERVVAFRDVTPVAPTHVLVIPREHHVTVTDLGRDEPAALVELVAVADRISHAEGHAGDYRLVFNSGAAVGQSVFHVHGHVLAGRGFTWPPG